MKCLKTLRRNGFKLGTRGLLAAALAVTAFGLAAPPASAATIVVNTTTDQSLGSCSSSCSLRDAVATAAPGDTVQIPAGTYVLTLGEIAIDSDLTLAGAGTRSTVLDGNAASRVLEVNAAVTISDLTVRNGLTSQIGGGILNQASLTVLRCLIAANRSGDNGGGIYSSGSLTVQESLVAGNQAGSAGGEGGGIYSLDSMVLTNSTVSGNSASGNGGGLSIVGGLNNILNSTIAGNSKTAAGPGGGGLASANEVDFLINTIIAGNAGGDCVAFNTNQLAVHSLDSDGSCGLAGPFGNLPGTNPLLGPLANNGGPTDTYALLAGSPAIDAGENAFCPPTDQRGVTRPQGPACDIGAFEAVPTPQEQIAALTAQINALITAGALSGSNANPLLNSLDNAAKHLDKGQATQTCKELGDFINKVNGDIQTGKLTAANGQALINAANAIRANLGC